MNTNEAKSQIVSQLREAGIEVPQTRIGGNARWIHIRLTDTAERDAAVAALAGHKTKVLAPADPSLYVIR